MTREQHIEHFMAMLKISRAEAEQLLEDDEADFIGEEGEKMTKKAKEVRRYEKADKPKTKKTKERKVDETKGYLLNLIRETLAPLVNITEIKTETEISFVYNDESYSLKLTKHRVKK